MRLMLSVVFLCGVNAWSVPGGSEAISKAVGSSERSEADRGRDEHRKPEQVLAFLGVKAGDKVADLSSGVGYYTDILCRVVGEQGEVTAHNVPFVIERFADAFSAEGPWEQRLSSPAWSQVKKLVNPLDDPKLPNDLDMAMMVLFYHDTVWQKTDRKAMNIAIFNALKPGGIYAVIDHSGAEGSGTRDCETLHRIEEATVIEEIKAAGFELQASSDVLRHPEDGRDYNVFRDFQTNRDHTDRFVLKFVKPAM